MSGLELSVDLEAHLGRIDSRLDKIDRRFDKANLPDPVYHRAVATTAAPASGACILGLARPPAGMIGYVRSLRVGGTTWATAAAGTADVYISKGDVNSGNVAALSLVDHVDHAASLPSVAFYGMGELVLQHDERLWVVVTTPTATQTYVASALVMYVQDRQRATGYNI